MVGMKEGSVGERGSLDTESLGGVVADVEPEEGRVEEGERDKEERDGFGEVVVGERTSSWPEVAGGLLGSFDGTNALEGCGLEREDGVGLL